jgi:hypothetical protein
MKRPNYEPQQESCIRRRLDRGASYTVSRSSDQTADMGSVTVLQGGLCMESSSKPNPQPSTRRRIQVAVCLPTVLGNNFWVSLIVVAAVREVSET